ncbi:MAG: hypothetical protein M5T61_15150 [Acidimicrobiia bacterium]|nr:hypothetical protein [Acidimicrobiia bacterium]
MSNEIWHAPEKLLDGFVADPGEIDSAAAASLEAHLLACDRCRGAVRARASESALEDSWHRVVAVIDTPRLSVVERVLIRLGVSESTARLLAGTPALSAAAAGSVAFVAAGFVASSRITESTGGFLVVAPLLPLLAVGAAFASVADPAGETAVPTPLQGVGLVLRRAAVILTAVFVILGAANLAIGGAGRAGRRMVAPGVGAPRWRAGARYVVPG